MLLPASKKQSFSPIAERLPERTAPELRYIQTKWASLMSYGMTVDLLEEVLPLHASATTIIRQVREVAEKMDEELGNEKAVFIDGCERDWEALPDPDGPLAVGIDGGYVHARDGENLKAGWFEVIVCKSIPENDEAKRFALVNGYDQKPRRRVFEMLKGQGFQMNQNIIFLSDGGDTLRAGRLGNLDTPPYLRTGPLRNRKPLFEFHHIPGNNLYLTFTA